MTAKTGDVPGLPKNHAQDGGWLQEQIHLEVRYGEIGISAVAAALRYSGVTKGPAYAPAAPIPERFHELAA